MNAIVTQSLKLILKQIDIDKKLEGFIFENGQVRAPYHVGFTDNLIQLVYLAASCATFEIHNTIFDVSNNEEKTLVFKLLEIKSLFGDDDNPAVD